MCLLLLLLLFALLFRKRIESIISLSNMTRFQTSAYLPLPIRPNPFHRPDQAFLLRMPPRIILLIPRHPPGRPNNLNLTTLRPAQKPSFPFHQSPGIIPRSFPLLTNPSTPLIPVVMINVNPPILRIPICVLHAPLNAGDEVEIAVERRRCRELVAPEVSCWIADAGTLRPELVASRTGEGAGSGLAAGTAVFGRVYVAVCDLVDCVSW